MNGTERGHQVAGCCATSRSKHLAMMGAAVFAAILFAGTASAQPSAEACGAFPKADNGPYDYLTVRDARLNVVEHFHFTPKVESLISGSTGTVAQDLDFVLRAFPNHHRALMSMFLLGERQKTPKAAGATYTVECYFERAIRFSPQDNTAKMIYATYLAKNARIPETVKQLEIVAASAGDNPFTHYNLGLIYFDIKYYDQALAQAHAAYGLGFGQPALKEKLQAAGKWQELPEAPANPAEAKPAETPK